MKHLLFIVEFYSPRRGGAETCFHELIQRLQHKHRITIITTRYDNSLPSQETQGNITIQRVWTNRWNVVFFAIKYCLSTWYNKKNKPDLIHSSTFTACIAAFVVGKILKVPVVLTVHELFWAWRYRFKWPSLGYIYKQAESLLVRLPWAHIHTVSVSTANAIRQHTTQDLTIIHLWVDQEKRNPLKLKTKNIAEKTEHKKTLLYIWHTGESKWVDELLQATPHILATHPDINIHLNVLPNNDNHHIAIMKKIASLWDRVTVTQDIPLSELYTLMQQADCVIIPSLTEWFWFVASEASACHKDLIVTQTAALPEVISWRIRRAQPGKEQSLRDAVDRRITDKPDTVIPQRFFSRDTTVSHMQRLYEHIRHS